LFIESRHQAVPALRALTPGDAGRQQEVASADPLRHIGHVHDMGPPHLAVQSLSPGNKVGLTQDLERKRVADGERSLIGILSPVPTRRRALVQ
jgi:hypothetical protein